MLEKRAKMFFYAEQLSNNRKPCRHSLLPFACVSLNSAHTSAREKMIIVSVPTKIYINFLPYERLQNCIFPTAVRVNLFKLKQRLENYCNNSSLELQ